MAIVQSGLYSVSDKYFENFRSEYLPDNKNEGRQYYYAFSDKDGIIWLVPLSSKVDAYRAKIAKDEKRYGVGKC